jgi:exodeoxyribonuclease VII small subunit
MSETNLTFEQAMQRLEQFVRTMERGEVPLDESLKLFQEGTELVSYCAKRLEDAQMQIRKVVKTADGSPAMEAFSDES